MDPLLQLVITLPVRMEMDMIIYMESQFSL